MSHVRGLSWTFALWVAALVGCGGSSEAPSREGGVDAHVADVSSSVDTGSSRPPDATRPAAPREASASDAPADTRIVGHDAGDAACLAPRLDCTPANAATTCAGGVCV